MQKLVDFGYNKYSQHGEDGIVAKLFELIGAKSKLCIEFGAWDGLYLSNTANLWTNGWKAVLIEGNPRRWEILKENTKGSDCVCIKAYVAREGPNSLESLLRRAGVDFEVDLLSIDIDGDDYHVLDSLDTLKPRIIICEYNPTIPAETDLYACYGNNFGASVSALARVAGNKGYKLVALTDTNCFFVRENLLEKLQDFEMSLEEIRIDRLLVFLITSYSGQYVLSGPGPYGSTFPYKGVLVGDCHRAKCRGTVAREIHDFLKPIKKIAKRILRRDQ